MTSTTGTNRAGRRAAFTMVEMMVVIALVAILMSAIVVAARGIRARTIRSTVKAQLGKIQMLVEDYKSKRGRYPNATRRVGMYHVNVWNNMTAEQRLFVMLFEASDAYRQQEIREDYVYRPDGEALREDGQESTVDADNVSVPVLIDLYGNQIAFDVTAKSYLIYSLGPDGVSASNDFEDNDDDGQTDEPDEERFNGKHGDDIMP